MESIKVGIIIKMVNIGKIINKTQYVEYVTVRKNLYQEIHLNMLNRRGKI